MPKYKVEQRFSKSLGSSINWLIFVYFTLFLRRTFVNLARLIRSLFTTQIVNRSCQADLSPPVYNQRPWPLTCSTLHLQRPVTDSMFYPPSCHHEFIGTEFYDYYGFICRPSVHNANITVALRA
jgi:hypothetical protein